MLKSVSHLIKGKQAENQAALFLKRQGLSIIATNVSYKLGEIDIIAKDVEHIIFVEVKYRKNNFYGSSVEMVNQSKQNRLRKAALMWLQEKDLCEKHPCRFDVIGISKQSVKGTDEIQWIQNAF